MNMNNSFSWKYRPLFYSFVLFMGLILFTLAIQSEQPQFYPYIIVVLSFVFILEIFSTIYFGNKILQQYSIPAIEIRDKFSNTIQHFVLPFSLFISIVMFIYFHNYVVIKWIILLCAFFLFWILFTNLRAFYEDKFKIEIKTHYIYDIISIISFFGLYDSVLNICNYWGQNLIITLLLLVFLILIYLGIILIRLYNYKLFKLILPYIVVNIGLFLLFNSLGVSSIKIAFISTLMYSFYIAYAHSHNENLKTYRIFEEYFVILCISIILLVFN